MPVSRRELSVLSLNVKGIRYLRKRKQNYTWLKDHTVNNSVIFFIKHILMFIHKN